MSLSCPRAYGENMHTILHYMYMGDIFLGLMTSFSEKQCADNQISKRHALRYTTNIIYNIPQGLYQCKVLIGRMYISAFGRIYVGDIILGLMT